MSYLHGDGIIHGDLRAVCVSTLCDTYIQKLNCYDQANVFVDSKGHIKIADFGLCVFAEGVSGNYYSMRSGNIRWTAPELIEPVMYRQTDQKPDIQPPQGRVASVRPTKHSDVYTFACLCIEVSVHSIYTSLLATANVNS
jgi:serine/threonine protein kinase